MRIVNQLNPRGRDDSTMTPMIDVVFLLLIFFVATSTLQMAEYVLPSSLALEASGGDAPEIPPELLDLEQVILSIDGGPGSLRYTINDANYATLGEVTGVLRQIASFDASVPVILNVAPQTPIGAAIRAYDAARVAGLRRIQFAASAAPSPSQP